MVALAGIPARAENCSDLSLDKVIALLHEAKINQAWSITQEHSFKRPWTGNLEVLSDREILSDRLCRSEVTDLDVVEKNGRVSVASKRSSSLVSFFPCSLADPGSFHEIGGPSDSASLQRLENDLDLVMVQVMWVEGGRCQDLRGTTLYREIR